MLILVRVVLLHDGAVVLTRRDDGRDVDEVVAASKIASLRRVRLDGGCTHAGGLIDSCPSFACEILHRIEQAGRHPAGVWAAQMNDEHEFQKGGPRCHRRTS